MNQAALSAYLTAEECLLIDENIRRHHSYAVSPGECTAMVIQHVMAPIDVVWSVVRRFDKPQAYKHFLKSCEMTTECDEGKVEVGSIREVTVVSGLPASYSRERLEVLDDENHVMSFRMVGGEHRLRNYRSTTSLHPVGSGSCCGGGKKLASAIVVESYAVAVPDGNTVEETITFVNTVVRCNLQSLARLSERLETTPQRDLNGSSLLRSSSAGALAT